MSKIKDLISDLMDAPEVLKPWTAIDEILSKEARVATLCGTLRDELDDEG